MDEKKPKQLNKSKNKINNKIVPVLVYKTIGAEKENEEHINRAFDILFEEVFKRQENTN